MNTSLIEQLNAEIQSAEENLSRLKAARAALGGEAVPERVGCDRLGDPRACGGLFDDPPCAYA